MFKFLLVLVLTVAFIEARPKGRNRGGKSGGESVTGSYESTDSGPLKASDFHDELQAVKGTALEMADAINNVKELAEKALSDPQQEGWEEFGEAMENTFSIVSGRFDKEVHRVSKLAEALWFGNNDLERDDKCGFVAKVDAHKEQLDNLELEWALAMIQDLACMSGAFSGAENIPFDMLKSDVHEDTAIEIVQSVVWEMHKISRAGDQFGKSMHNIAAYLGIESEEGSEGKSGESSEGESGEGSEGESGEASEGESGEGSEGESDETSSQEGTTESSVSSAGTTNFGGSSENTTVSNASSAKTTESPITSDEKRTLYRLTRFLKRFSTQ